MPARIVPGFAILVIFFRIELERAFHSHQIFFSSPYFFASCLLPLAWVAGLAIDGLTFFPAWPLISRNVAGEQTNCFDELVRFVLDRPHANQMQIDPPKEIGQKRRSELLEAEITMCRSLGFVCLYVSIWCLSSQKLVWSILRQPEIPSDFNPWLAIFGCLVFGVTWWKLKYELRLRRFTGAPKITLRAP